MEIKRKAILLLPVLISMTMGNSVSKYTQSGEECKLHVTNKSQALFTETILKHKYNFLYMKLNFDEINDNITSTKAVIGLHHWVWTYKGEDGGHQYLFLPQDFGYLSFGLLWSKSSSSEYNIDIEHEGGCHNLKVGENSTDQLIGNALGEMTEDIANRHERYNSSYWCYYRRLYIKSESKYRACQNSICTLQTIEFECCKFVISYITRKRSIECSKDHYHFNQLWWALPIVVGQICFAFYPLLLAKIGDKIQKMSGESRATLRRLASTDTDIMEEEYVKLKQDYPVTFVSTIISPFKTCCSLKSPLVLRLLRTTIILLPMLLPAIRIYLDNKYSPVLVEESLKKGATLGFSSLAAGTRFSGQFLYLLGGPLMAIILYIVFGLIFILFPSNFARLLENGLFNRNGNKYFILTIPMKYREKLGSITVRKCSGYKTFNRYLLVQLYMILNWRFWRHTIRIFVNRWRKCLDHAFRACVCRSAFVYISLPVMFFIYLTFCLVELAFSILYFSLPVICCFFILIHAYIKSIKSHFGNQNRLVQIFVGIFICGAILAFCVVWYMYCIMFFDGFWFLCRIVMFTYTGIFQFPNLSYGYLILVLMTFYYLTESISMFGASYRELLKISIEVCERAQNKRKNEFALTLVRKNSIPRKLFEIIIEKHMPKRIQMFKTIVMVALIVSVLCISLELLAAFDKFQDLSLLSHVFTVLFICALPKILRDMCTKRLKHRTKKKLRQSIYQTVSDYIQKEGEVDSLSDFESYNGFSTRGYESLDIASD